MAIFLACLNIIIFSGNLIKNAKAGVCTLRFFYKSNFKAGCNCIGEA
jgi:hypothetical protein